MRVREGAPIGRSLGQSRLFPPMMIHLISSGETSGELDTMLERAAVHQERELDSILQGVVGLLGPGHDPGDGRPGAADRARDADADLPAERAGPLAVDQQDIRALGGPVEHDFAAVRRDVKITHGDFTGQPCDRALVPGFEVDH